MRVTDDPQSEIAKLIQEILPVESTAKFQLDPITNGIILIDKAQNIKGFMKILNALDQTDFQEKVEIIRLRYLGADVVSRLFNENILKTADTNRYRLDARKAIEPSYFSKYIKIIPELRTNSLIILGKAQAVDRVREFIYKYIDVELESGKSILHIYQLQYLDGSRFVRVLQNIVKSIQSGTAGQARVDGAPPIGGTERFFGEVFISSDAPSEGRPPEEVKYYGGNKIVVAATNEDWERIRKIIEEMDIPQPQVIIEVLIADLTLSDVRALGSLVRNPTTLPFPGTPVSPYFQTMNFQSAQAQQVILDSTGETMPPTTIQSDILSKQFADDDSFPGSAESVAATFPAGSGVIEYNDPNGKTWGITQILKLFDAKKIISNPHIISTNNKKAYIEIGQERLLRDEAAAGAGGAINIPRRLFKAYLKVDITPRISAADEVELKVNIDINEFINENGDMLIRNVFTNANVKNRDILALGGLTRTDTVQALNQTPLLGQIPIFGWLFKSRNNNIAKTNLTVFISPTIVLPRLRGGISEYTQDYVDLTKKYAQRSELFDNLRDPITRMYFRADYNSTYGLIDDFIKKDSENTFFNDEGVQVYNEEETTADWLDRLDDPRNQALLGMTSQKAESKQLNQAPVIPNRGAIPGTRSTTELYTPQERLVYDLKDLLKDETNPLLEQKEELLTV